MMEPRDAVTRSHCLVLWQGARRASCPTVDNPWAAGSSCRTQSEHTGDDWGSRYSGSKMTEGVIQPLWVRPAKRDRRKRGSTTSHHMRGIHQRSNELSRMTWRNDRDYRCSRDQRRHGEETGHRWMIRNNVWIIPDNSVRTGQSRALCRRWSTGIEAYHAEH